MSGVNTMHKGWWVGENSEGRPSSVSAAFPASWLLLEYETGYPAGLPLIQWTRIFKSQTASDQMMYNTCNSITDDLMV